MEQPSTVLRPPGTDPVARAEALLALTDLLARTTDDLPVLLRTAAETIARLCGDTAGVWLVEGPDDERAMRVRAWWHLDPRARADMAALGADVRLPEHEPGFLWSVATRGPVLLPRIRIEDLRGVNAAYLTYFRRWGLASMVLVPLRARDRLLGLLGVSRDAAGAPYDDQDLAFAVRVGTHLSLALDNARLVAEVRQELRDRIEAEEALRHQAHHDALTGLANRVQLRTALDAALVRGPVALLVADLDGFKEVNDALGHGVGDDALRIVAGRLQSATPRGAVLARLGGDEFAVVLPGAGRDGGVRAAQALRASLTASVEVAASRLALTASVGVAVAPDDGSEAGSLLRLADVAMYRAKRGRTGVATYDPVVDAAATERLPRLTELRRALTGGELVVHWQPVVAVPSGRVSHREGLVRWQHPERGLLGADQVVPLAEQGGLAGELTDVVLGLTLRRLQASREAGRPRPVAVNVPPSVLAGDGWVARVLRQLDRHGVPAAELLLEVTESAMADDAGRRGLHELADAGVRLALDDFGTGWSSLAHLRDLPVHQLKIDRSFVTGLADRATDRTVVRTITTLGHDLGLEVVAEGVETPAVRDLLVELGVDLQQGWLHGRPAADDGEPP